MRPDLELHIDDESIGPGDVVRGIVRVVDGGVSRSLTLALEFHDDSEDYRNVVRREAEQQLCQGDLVADTTFPFEVRLPEDALPNYRSSHGELYWDVHVEADRAGLDMHVRQRLEVTINRPGNR
jgi:hypothetical protein